MQPALLMWLLSFLLILWLDVVAECSIAIIILSVCPTLWPKIFLKNGMRNCVYLSENYSNKKSLSCTSYGFQYWQDMELPVTVNTLPQSRKSQSVFVITGVNRV